MNDLVFIAPADIPTLRGDIVDRLLAVAIEATTQESTLTRRPVTSARYGGGSGHPALVPWSLTPQILDLGDGEGVDRVVKRQERHYVDFPAEDRVSDIDTPETYERLFIIAKSRSKGRPKSNG